MKDTSYKWYLLGLLLLIQAFSSVDRLALGLLNQDIKLDLSLSDSEVGVLDGIAFALFYATVGIPMARWADRGNRVTIVTCTTALWSVAVAVCGAAHSFVQLALNRVVVGIGEAGCVPVTNSMVPDRFGRAERARAMSIIALSSPLATVIGYGAAGWIGQHYGWRTTFLILGLPGVPLAALAAFTLREPRMDQGASVVADGGGQPVQLLSFWQTCTTLWRIASFRHLTIAYVVALFFNFGIYQLLPMFFIRSYGMQTGELGGWLAVSNGVAGFAGTYLGGELASRFARNNEPAQLKAMAIIFAVTALLFASVFVMPNKELAFGFMALFIILGMTINGPMDAIKQSIVPERTRASSFALVSLLGNLIGMGLGPLAGGALSDLLHPMLGDESLRYALLILTPGYLWAAWHLWAARKTVLQDVSRVESGSAGAPLEATAANILAH